MNIISSYLQELCSLKPSVLLIRGLIFTAAMFLVVSSAWAPIYQSWQGFPAGESIYNFLNPICHQYPSRSFWIFDRPFALCSRCFAGYLGLALASIFFIAKWSYLKRLLWGLLLISPGTIDPIIQFLTPYESTNILRLITGLLGGVAVFMIFYPLSMKSELRGEIKQ